MPGEGRTRRPVLHKLGMPYVVAIARATGFARCQYMSPVLDANTDTYVTICACPEVLLTTGDMYKPCCVMHHSFAVCIRGEFLIWLTQWRLFTTQMGTIGIDTLVAIDKLTKCYTPVARRIAG